MAPELLGAAVELVAGPVVELVAGSMALVVGAVLSVVAGASGAAASDDGIAFSAAGSRCRLQAERPASRTTAATVGVRCCFMPVIPWKAASKQGLRCSNRSRDREFPKP